MRFVPAGKTVDIASSKKTFAGVLLGTAIGDSLGLPAEGLSRERIQKRWHGVWKQRFLLRRGMVSDDTEHTVMVAQSLLSKPNDPIAFQREFARRLRWWFIRLPAGVGLATARACLKLWLGISPEQSGVFSAGNGPAMRSAIIGLYFYNDNQNRRAFVRASTRVTHVDPKAEVAAIAVAEAAACAFTQNETAQDFLFRISGLSEDDEWNRLVQQMKQSFSVRQSVADFAKSLGLAHGVSGYAYHTVPVALYAWMLHKGDFAATVESALNCGGDTDTVGAIAGALAGISSADTIPQSWLDGVRDWPCSKEFLHNLASRLADSRGDHDFVMPVNWCWPGALIRNLFFLAIVLFHGFRRLFPPY